MRLDERRREKPSDIFAQDNKAMCSRGKQTDCLKNVKLVVAPYNHTIGSASPRNFGDWSPSGELSFANGGNMYSCYPFFGSGPALTPFTGSFTVRVY
jgi:hypothetical protein